MTRATTSPVYGSCGLRLRSEVPLPLPTMPDTDSDVDVHEGAELDPATSRADPAGEPIACYQTGGTRWYTAWATPSGHLLRFHGRADFLVSPDLRRIEVRRHAGDAGGLVPIFLAGTVTAFVLSLRGQTVLHASAVATDDSTIAFIGQSGRGKSTLAALLCDHGAALVTDDLLAVDPGPPVTCAGGASEIRLRPAAAALAHGCGGTSARTTSDGRLALTPAAWSGDRGHLGALIVPGPSRTVREVRTHRLGPVDALRALLAFPRISGWRDREVIERDFSALAAVANTVPVYAVVIPWGPPFDPAVAEALAGLAVG